VTDFNQFFKKELNDPQKKAVTQKKGSIVVIAGAGSGKTRVITARIAHLILNEQVDPGNIVALTFTNKAANEMKHLLINFLGSKHQLPFVGTFHSYCLLLLKTHPHILPFTEFTILDADDQKTLIKKILKKYHLEKQFSTSDVCYQISNFKNKLQSDKHDEWFAHKLLKEIFLTYESEKSAAHSFDFDDLILTVLKAFQTNMLFKNHFQNHIKHILVDEYQDTNMIQHELIKQMSCSANNTCHVDSICIVGDEDQSIYSWRGAISTNMLQFQKDFKPAKLIKIEQNYRSVQPILHAANQVIANNSKRTKKELWSNKKAKNRILSLICRSERQEASVIANYISCLPKNFVLNNLAILYRTHFQSRNIEEELIRNAISYKIVGGIRFYERKEIKDLLAYLRLIVNPFDRTSLFRIINCPTRGLGAKFEELLYIQWNQNPLYNFKQLLTHIINNQEINIATQKKLTLFSFLNIFPSSKQNMKASDIIEYILEKTDYLTYLKKTFDQKQADTKIENIQEFIQSIYDFEKTENKPSLNLFLENVALMQEKLDDETKVENQVQLMTLHAAKGLEFDTIIITGLEEGILPGYRSFNSKNELEEERRLFYVGVTRAQERLLLTRTITRSQFGQINDQNISRFITEIPKDLIEVKDVSEIYTSQIISFFNSWLKNKNKTVLTFNDFSSPKFSKKKSISRKKIQEICTWKKNQLVKHKKFGVGLIKKVEKKEGDTFYVTASFKIGDKKILSQFLKQI
jgi:DNA helicase-2/ATP-dependent DNA helicase PcrA